MKVIKKTTCTLFPDVEVGGVFQCANAIFMRTDDIDTEFGLMNAINLENAKPAHFFYDDEVSLLPRAHIIIE